MKKSQKTALQKCINKKRMTLKEFDKIFNTEIANNGHFVRLNALIRINDAIMLPNGTRLKSKNYMSSFEVQTDKAEIKAYYQQKAKNARIRAQLVK